MNTLFSRYVFAAIVVIGTTFAYFHSASAQTPICGLGSTWNGQTCIGPRGKAFCPAGMTMQGQSCMSDVTQQNQVTHIASPSFATSPTTSTMPNINEGDHARIIAMLTNLTNQVNQANNVVAQLLADQSANNIKFQKLEETVQQQNALIQQQGTLIQQQQTTLQKLQQSIDAQSNSSLQHFTNLNNADITLDSHLTNLLHHEIGNCYIATLAAPATFTSRDFQIGACNGSDWDPWFADFVTKSMPFKY